MQYHGQETFRRTSGPQHVAERRSEKRHQARLPFQLSLLDERAGLEEMQRTITLAGHTHDISSGGVSLIGPLIRFGYRYLMGRSNTLRITLDLPAGTIEMEGTPVRYVQLEAGGTDGGFIMSGGAETDNNPTEICCLIGVRLTGMSARDRALYDEYLRLLEQVEAEQTAFILSIEEELSEDAFLAHLAA